MGKPRMMVIAGSDSSGGAGLEADQKVIAAHGCYAMTATTALTAQNTQGVFGIHETPPEFVRKQIEACIDDIGIDAIKTGMLASAETMRVVADALKRYEVPFCVVDPVMVSTTGARLLPEAAVRTLRECILPLTSILTPNIPEAQLLLKDAGVPVKNIGNVDDVVGLAKAVKSLGPRYVLVKGGHLPLTKDRCVALEAADRYAVVDVLVGEEESIVVETPYLKSKNTHGTGCSLASAITCNLANGHSMAGAVKKACHYVEAGIKTSVDLGRGSGPINHFHSTYTLPFPPGRFIEYLLERPDVQKAWRAHTEHEFVNRMADGSLPLEAFKYYLIQDYLYLIQFARANALAAYKAKTLEDISMSASIVGHIHRETSLHLDYCKEFGLSKEEVEAHEESQACTAYTRYVLDVGQAEDWLALQMALAPCLIGYAQIARRLHDDAKTVRAGNRYWRWIENYVAQDYTDAVKLGSELLETQMVKQSPSRLEELAKIFIHATNMETGFWDMGSRRGRSEDA